MANTSQDSIEYYREREQQEIALAEAATAPAIKKIHLEMSERYREMIERHSATRLPQSGPGHPVSMP